MCSARNSWQLLYGLFMDATLMADFKDKLDRTEVGACGGEAAAVCLRTACGLSAADDSVRVQPVNPECKGAALKRRMRPDRGRRTLQGMVAQMAAKVTEISDGFKEKETELAALRKRLEKLRAGARSPPAATGLESFCQSPLQHAFYRPDAQLHKGPPHDFLAPPAAPTSAAQSSKRCPGAATAGA